MSTDLIKVKLAQTRPIPLDMDFSCGVGEILVLLGPSGSGKTTALRSIAGLYEPRQGKISANGIDWLNPDNNINLPPQQRRAGLVFQDYALFPHLTAFENISVAVDGKDRDIVHKKVTSLLKTVNMEGLEERYPSQLSGGQQQRVALARALAREPKVLLLDEPFSAVDQQTRRKLVRELIQLKGQLGLPIIHVTHDLNEARRIADRICIIHHGKTLQLDSPQEIMAHPVNSHVAHLVGHYNVFTATVENHDAGQGITTIRWYDHVLETLHRPEFKVGDEVDWVIPAENLILHRRDRPSRGERENPVSGEIDEFIVMGETTSVSVRVNGDEATLTMSVPTHVAERNGLNKGGQLSVSLLGKGIHLMPRS